MKKYNAFAAMLMLITATSGGLVGCSSDSSSSDNNANQQIQTNGAVRTYSVKLKEVRINHADAAQSEVTGLPLNGATISISQ